MKWLNFGEWLSIRVNLDLKPYYKDYKSLLFYEELDRVEFSLCDQYSTIRVSIIILTISKIQSYLYNETNKKTCFKTKLIKYLFITYNQYLFYISQILDCNIQSSKTTCYRSWIFLKILAYHLHKYSLI